MKILSFGSIREDRNTLQFLKDSENPITLPKERKLKEALSNIYKDAAVSGISPLMLIAENNKYGLKGNSALKKYLRENSPIGDLPMENTDWHLQLQRAVRHAINRIPKNKREALEKDFYKIFIEQKSLTDEEKNIIKFRNDIINSNPIQKALAEEKTKADTNKSLSYLDYFIASSEVTMKDKTYILSKLNHMLSDKYKINPQLKDRKAQLFGEIINDLVVKTPESPVLTTKDCSQEQHGSCAAISMARKLLVYEDKRAYVDTILKEVDIRPNMDIYDVTRLLEYKDNPKKYKYERAPKVRVDKAVIDYDKALKQGYRIIDASVLNWMKIAGSIGDGQINLENYYAFDSNHNAFMHDTRIVSSIDKDYVEQHKMIRTLIKANNLLDEYEKKIQQSKINQHLFAKYGVGYQKEKGEAYNQIRAVVDKIVTDKTISEKSSVIKGLLNIKNVNTNNNDDELKKQIATYFTDSFGEKYSSDFKRSAEKFLDPVKSYVAANDELKKITPDSAKKTRMMELIFKIGVAQREVISQSAKLDEIKPYIYEELHLPDRSTQIKNEIKRLKKLAVEKPDSPSIKNFQKKNGIKKENILKELQTIDKTINEEIPETIDALLSIFGTSYKGILLDTVATDIEEHEKGNFQYMYDLCNAINMTPDPKKFGQKLHNIYEKIEKARDYKELEAVVKEVSGVDRNSTVLAFKDNLFMNLFKMIQDGKFSEAQKAFTEESRPQSIEEMAQRMEFINEAFDKIVKMDEIIAKKINYPSAENVIIKKIENVGKILKKEQLDDLEEKFESINAFEKKASNPDNKKNVAKGDMYKFSDAQRAALKQIEQNIQKFKQDVKFDYKTINKEFKDYLDKAYEELGKRKGTFWVYEEGHSGLHDLESVRIIEQMTGRPYHIEKDIDTIVRNIKDGNGSGASSTMVSYDSYSGHAQYIADVKPISYKNSETGEVVTADVIFHDNTWGHRENRGKFIDGMKILRTDYGSGYGGKKAFILDKSGLEGEFVDDYKFDYGMDKTERTSKATEGGSVEIDVEEGFYPIMMGARMPGIDPRIPKRIDRIFSYIYNIKNEESIVNDMFSALEKVKDTVELKSLTSADDSITKIQEQMLDKIGGNGKKILQIEEFDALPDNDPLKIIINKLIIRKALNVTDDDDKLDNLKTKKGLEKYKQDYKKGVVDNWLAACLKDIGDLTSNISKEITSRLSDKIIDLQDKYDIGLLSFSKELPKVINSALKANLDSSGDVMIRSVISAVSKIIYSDSELKKLPADVRKQFFKFVKGNVYSVLTLESIDEFNINDASKGLLKFIDKYYNPNSDEEVMAIYRKFINMPKKELENLFSKVTFEDLGIKFDSPQTVLKMIQARNDLETSRFEDEVRLHYFDDYLPIKPSYRKHPVPKELTSFNNKYRVLDVDLSSIGGEQYLKEMKDIAFWKYKCRPAIPSVKIKSAEELEVMLQGKLKEIRSTASSLRLFEITKKFLKSLDIAEDMVNNRQIETKKEKFKELLSNFKKMADMDSQMSEIVRSIGIISDKISADKIDYDAIKTALSKIKENKNTVLPQYTIGDIEAIIKNAKKDLHLKKNIIKTNILPKYQLKVAGLLNEWVSDIMKNGSNTENNKYDELMSSMIKHHLLNEPSQLLYYAVQQVVQKPEVGQEEEHSAIHEEIKQFLIEAYSKANKANLEYKLMKAARLGVASKLKDYIKENNVNLTLTDKSQVEALSDVGINKIISSLSDVGTDHSTLILFMEQTGLVQQFLETIYKTDLRNEKKSFLQLSKNILAQQISEESLDKNFEKALEKIPPETKFTDKSQLMNFYKELCEILDNSIYDRRNLKDSAVFYEEQFKRIIDSLNEKELLNIPLRDVADEIHSTVSGMLRNGLSILAESAVSKINEINSKIGILENVRLLENSKDDKIRNDYVSQLKDVLNFGIKVLKEARLNVVS